VKTLLLKSIVTMSAPTARNYLITGGARGIGRGLSRILLSSGHRVCILDNNTEELDHAAALFAKSHTRGRDFEAIACNLRQPAEIRSAVGRASKLFDGKLDVLVNNAAYTAGVGAANAGNMTLEMWTASLETNLTAPMLMSQHCLPMLAKSPSRTSGGSIVNISSTRAIMSEPDNEAYATTKAGLLGLTQSMAVSLGSQGVRVNAILPGWIHVENECKDADVQGRKWEDGLSEADHAWHLTGRVGKVEDVLRAVQYLSESEGVSGTEVVVDGGVTKKMVYPEE
jgi:NAD(P)-dependent dehydrogenase (short-subunit alcohol dehydrogenase family)